ncbi:MAG TPA: PspC domain-containing protein [Bacillota bacterium]|nr:PspC domain-containing protein [Bacillota bacterium]
MVKRLYRSESDRMVAGVLGGLATYFNIDSTIVRLLFIVGLFMSVFALTLFYLAAVIIIPNEGDIH